MELVELEVRWMSSGESVCCLHVSSKLCVAEIKAQVHEKSSIPVEEQCLFWNDGTELADDVDFSAAPTGAVEVATGQFAASGHAELCGVQKLLLVWSVSDPRSFRATQNFPVLSKGGFKKVRKLSTGINGDIVLHYWLRENGGQEPVAVKLLPNDRLANILGTETDERTIHMGEKRKGPHAEDALTEIGILMHLSCQVDVPGSLLRMCGVFAEPGFTWLITEYCEGGELFEIAAANAAATEPQLRLYMADLLNAVSYLHGQSIGHRDISLENILLKNDQIKLMDFGMAVRSHSTSGTTLRYFRPVGKDFYRAPECYVPRVTETKVQVPDNAKGGDVIMATCDEYLCEVRLPPNARPGQMACVADVWGYAVGPADVWAVGICLFILAFQCPPWNWAMLDDDAFGYVHAFGVNSSDCGLEAVLKSWGKTPLSKEAMQFLRDVLQPDPVQRPSASECLQSLFFREAPGTQDAVRKHPDLETSNLGVVQVVAE